MSHYECGYSALLSVTRKWPLATAPIYGLTRSQALPGNALRPRLRLAFELYAEFSECALCPRRLTRNISTANGYL